MRSSWSVAAGLALVVALGLAVPVGVTSAGATAQSSGVDTAVTTDPSGSISTQRWETVTVTLRANATNVAGYQSAVTYDPAVLQVNDVSGTEDFATPVATVDNRNGSVVFNQIRSGETTDPELAELTVGVIGTDGQRSELSVVDDETTFSDATGETFEPNRTTGVTVTVQSAGTGGTETDASAQSGPGFGASAVLAAAILGVGWVVRRHRRET